MTRARRGVYAAAITPVAPDGAPDLPRLAAYCARMIGEGLTGVAPAGTTGEGNSLPMSARLEMPGHFAEAGLPPDRVITGTGACATDDAVALTRACLEAGYPCVLVLPPFYYKSVTEDGLFAHYARLIEAVGDSRLRLYLYHFPQMSAVPIPVRLVARLKAAYGPVVAGLKDSSGDYEGTLAFARAAEDFDVFPSSEAVLLKGMAEGCAGVISATVNAAPALVARTLADGRAEDQAALARLRAIIADYPLSAALKQIEAWKSGDAQWRETFPPLVPLDTETATRLEAALTAFADETGEKVFSPHR